MTIAALESLSFGLGRMAEAAEESGHRLCLLTGDRSVYRHELATLPPDALDVVDVDTDDPEAVRRALAALPRSPGSSTPPTPGASRPPDSPPNWGSRARIRRRSGCCGTSAGSGRRCTREG